MKTDTIAIIGGAALALFVLYKVVNKPKAGAGAKPTTTQQIALDNYDAFGLGNLSFGFGTASSLNGNGVIGLDQDFGQGIYYNLDGSPYRLDFKI